MRSETFRTVTPSSAFSASLTRAAWLSSVVLQVTSTTRVSWWDSVEARERYRLSPVEAERQRAMAPYVEAESSGLYVGRELEIPKSP